jgi:1-phosphatidylinositol-4-phosphate 5-kinase
MLDDLTFQNLAQSLDFEKNLENIYSAGTGAGKSGSFFFHSSDSKFILKTIKSSEMKTLLNMIDEYHQYFVENNNESLIAKIYGVFTI